MNIIEQYSKEQTPKIFGILNLTPDSFYDGGTLKTPAQIHERIAMMVEEGVDVLDVGAVSTRPGSEEVTPRQEIDRLEPALEIIRKHYPELPLSIDTYRTEIANWAHVNFKIQCLNDISGGQFDPDMIDWVADHNIPYIMMHIKGNPGNMQEKPFYSNVIEEVVQFFKHQIGILWARGFTRIIIDPGFGFGKTIRHNYKLLSGLQDLSELGMPVMVGMSRKSMIYKVLENTPDKALNATTALHMVALINGAAFLRVHDVREASECIRLFKVYRESSS